MLSLSLFQDATSQQGQQLRAGTTGVGLHQAPNKGAQSMNPPKLGKGCTGQRALLRETPQEPNPGLCDVRHHGVCPEGLHHDWQGGQQALQVLGMAHTKTKHAPQRGDVLSPGLFLGKVGLSLRVCRRWWESGWWSVGV